MMNALQPPQAQALALMNRAQKNRKDEGGLAHSDPHDFVRPKLSLLLKLEVSKVPLTDRHIVNEAAEVLEEMLTLLDDKDGVINGE